MAWRETRSVCGQNGLYEQSIGLFPTLKCKPGRDASAVFRMPRCARFLVKNTCWPFPRRLDCSTKQPPIWECMRGTDRPSYCYSDLWLFVKSYWKSIILILLVH